jgi:peptidyl-prolyl cis-trans isomerase A (cyclophilin A)
MIPKKQPPRSPMMHRLCFWGLGILLSIIVVGVLIKQTNRSSSSSPPRLVRGADPPEQTTTSTTGAAPPPVRVAFDLAQLKGTSAAGVMARSETLVIELMEEWAPIGVAHFQELLAADFYNDVRFFRVVPNFVAQFGISGDPATQTIWKKVVLPDDPVKHSNERGTITYATSGPNSRTTQLFINLKDNASLDQQGFAPFARIVAGLEWIDAIEDKYREKPNQNQIQQRGNAYLEENFPDLSFIAKAKIL